MNDITSFLEMDWKNGLLFFAAVIIVFVWAIQKWDFICQKFGIKTKRKLAEEKQDNDISELKEHAKKTDGNIDKLLMSIETLQASVHSVSDQVQVLQKKNDMNEAARLKDRIAQGYRYYRDKKRWTSMEKEAMEEMVRAYSQYSENSFVHSIVEKEMHTWEVIDE